MHVMNEKKDLVIFDMDGVLVEQRSSWRIVHDHFGVDNEGSFRLYMDGEIDDLEFMRRDIRIWKGLKGDITLSDVGGILHQARPVKGIHEAAGELREAGFDLHIVTGGIDLLAERLAGSHGFSRVFANGLSADGDGYLDGEGILRVPLRDKGAVVRELVRGRTVCSVGDSSVDLSLFELSDLSIAFRPMDREAARGADLTIPEADLRLVSRAILKAYR